MYLHTLRIRNQTGNLCVSLILSVYFVVFLFPGGSRERCVCVLIYSTLLVCVDKYFLSSVCFLPIFYRQENSSSTVKITIQFVGLFFKDEYPPKNKKNIEICVCRRLVCVLRSIANPWRVFPSLVSSPKSYLMVCLALTIILTISFYLIFGFLILFFFLSCQYWVRVTLRSFVPPSPIFLKLLIWPGGY